MAKILIVDDEPAIRKTLREILQFEKYEVDEASDGIQCLGKLKNGKYDVIIMDIKMPKMDGMEALERVQMISSDTPVIMISGHANIDTAVDAVKKGAF
ncbi:MAG TPA: response regulator, partial [Phaeodactylibacter sp.]|nr:response regulator [Phaeodactylibacter sp.]